MVRLANNLDKYNVRPRRVYRIDKNHFKFILESELESHVGMDIKLHVDYDDETFGIMVSLDGDFEHSLGEEEYENLTERLPERFNIHEWFDNARYMIEELTGETNFVSYADVDSEVAGGFTIVIELLDK